MRNAIVIAITLLLCVLLYAGLTRYSVVGVGMRDAAGVGGWTPTGYKIDRWTGRVSVLLADEEWPVYVHSAPGERSFRAAQP